ncbi:MAG TPA: ATP-binding domain-containing protein, partial [Verrucomicrobiota bacterium]|nr:ATP-binding domain-containing protein [Verrucomicrobiota bacterium]
KDQLASVEAGNVLGDLCAQAEPNRFSPELAREYSRVSDSELPLNRRRRGNEALTSVAPSREYTPGIEMESPHVDSYEVRVSGEGGRRSDEGGVESALADGLVELQTNYRFGPASGIHQASQAVRRGDAETVLKLLESPKGSDDGSIAGRAIPGRSAFKAALRDRILQHYGGVVQTRDPQTALEMINQFRLLAAVREGPYGVLALNGVIEEILRDAGLLGRTEEWYAGRQILVTANDYSLDLFNGDLGIALGDAAGLTRVWFPGPEGTVRSLAPARLPAHETAFALTVHKSQGSEFEEVLLVLPDRSSRVLTRELIYTGLTRARKRTEVWYDTAVFREAVARRTVRSSGLRDRLWASTS